MTIAAWGPGNWLALGAFIAFLLLMLKMGWGEP